jgi:type II secretory pathway component PulM
VKQWFLRFSSREQVALLLMAAVVLLWLLFVAAIRPLDRARDQLAQTNLATAESLQRVDTMAAAILAQREAGGAPARSRNLTALLNSGAEAAGLRIARLQPNNRGAVQLRLESVSFDAFLRWLHRLESGEGLIVEELSVSQAGAAGFVNASLRVNQAL